MCPICDPFDGCVIEGKCICFCSSDSANFRLEGPAHIVIDYNIEESEGGTEDSWYVTSCGMEVWRRNYTGKNATPDGRLRLYSREEVEKLGITPCDACLKSLPSNLCDQWS